MKFGVSTYSFGAWLKENGMEATLDKIKEYGGEVVDFTFRSDDHNADLETAKQYHGYMDKIGLEGACYCIPANFLDPDTEATVDMLMKRADVAKALGCAAMRFDISNGFPAGTKGDIGYDRCISIAAPLIRRVADYCASIGVVACTENHGHFSQGALRVEKMINTVNHENFGALVDVGNFMCFDEDCPRSVGILAKHAVHTHAKDMYFRSGDLDHPGEGWWVTSAGNLIKGTIIGYGNAKVKQSLRVLKRAGYDGTMSIEFEGAENPLDGVRIGLANLNRFWAEI